LLAVLPQPEYHIDEVTNFVWQTSDGEDLRPVEMPTRYLFNCLKMIFNNTAPAALRVAPFKARPLRWSARYRRAACVALLRALKGRELTTIQADELRSMKSAVTSTWPSFAALL
jgi:hypothetical protein